MPNIKADKLRGEIDRLWSYDGPAHPKWSSSAVNASLVGIMTFIALGIDADDEASDDLSFWAFEGGLFPGLSEVLDVSEAGVRWKPEVSSELRDDLAGYAMKIVHANVRGKR